MALQTANQFQLSPDFVGAARQGLQLGGQFRQQQQLATNQQLGAQQQQQIQDLSSRAAAGDPQALTQLSGIDPARAKQVQTFQATQQENRFNSVVDAALEIQSLPTPQAKLAKAKQRKEQLQSQGIPTQDTDEFIQFMESGDIEGANKLIEGAVNAGVQRGRFKATSTKPQELDLEKQRLEQQATSQRFKESQAGIKAGELSPTVQKILDTAQTEAIGAGQRARSLSVLAEDVSNLDIGGGLKASATETFKTLLGTQDDVSELRRRYNAIRASQAVQNLPPGPASDKDIALALSGFPKENAGGQQLVSFLKGAAKLEGINAAFQTFKSDLLSETKSTKGMLQKWKSKVSSSVLDRDIEMSELFITAQEEGMSIGELKEQLGVE